MTGQRIRKTALKVGYYFIYRGWLYVCFGILLTQVFSLDFFSFHRKKQSLYDTFVKLKGHSTPDPRIILVTVTRELYERDGVSWPIPMEYHTKVLKFLSDSKADVIGVDFQINAWDKESDEEISELCRVIGGTDTIVWGREIAEDMVSLIEVPSCLPNANSKVFFQVFRSGQTIQEYQKYTRYFYGYYWVLNKKLVTLDLEIAGKYLSKDPSEDQFYEQQLFIDFKGPKNTYPQIPAVDILDGKVSKKIFKDKIVLYGVADDFNMDFYHRTPFYHADDGKFSMSRTEIHANILDTILNRSYIWLSSPLVTNVLTFLVSTLTCAMVFSTSPMPGILFLGAEFLTLIILTLVSFRLFNYYIDLFHPLLAVFISYYIFIPYRLIKEYKARWKIEEEVKILNKVEELKTNFLSLMTHDLKTPIARIQGLAEVMINEGQLSSTQSQHIQRIIQSAEEFTSFINKILNFTKIESTGVQLHLKSKDINKIIEETIEMLRYDGQTKNIELVADLEPLFPIKIDPDLIKQVIKNLIENAIKYSPPDKTITIQTRDEDGMVVMRISDQGLGIGEKDLDNIFIKFYRIKDDRLTMAKGTGLGLYLVKYFIELHKGTIGVVSKLGEGSTFTVRLPAN